MPIYEYKCDKCKNEFEVLFMSMGEVKKVACPSCKSKKTRRLLSVFGGKVGNEPLASSGGGCSSCSSSSCSSCGH